MVSHSSTICSFVSTIPRIMMNPSPYHPQLISNHHPHWMRGVVVEIVNTALESTSSVRVALCENFRSPCRLRACCVTRPVVVSFRWVHMLLNFLLGKRWQTSRDWKRCVLKFVVDCVCRSCCFGIACLSSHSFRAWQNIFIYCTRQATIVESKGSEKNQQ